MYCLTVFASLVACVFGASFRHGLVPMPDGRIVGGHDANIEDYPWQISMNYYGSHRCGGSVFKPNVIISAAHCVTGTSASSMSIRAGSINHNSGGESRAVSKISYHEKYNGGTIDYDISILILASPFDLSDRINLIAVPAPGEPVAAGAISHISGWGGLREGGGTPSALQVVEVPVVSNEDCNAAYQSMNPITDRMICAGENGGGKDACQGDSGGPMVVDNKLVGIVSWGYGCARPNYPGVYSRVAALISWVDDQLNRQ